MANLILPSTSLVDQYARVSRKLSECWLTAAKLYDCEEEPLESMSRSATHDNITAELASIPNKPPYTEASREGHTAHYLPYQTSSKHYLPVLGLLIEYVVRFKTWERECSLSDITGAGTWLKQLSEDNGLYKLLENTLKNQENGIDKAINTLTSSPDILDDNWQRIALENCQAIGLEVMHLVELQPLIQMFRASASSDIGQGEGPLVKYKSIIKHIRDSFALENALSILVDEDEMAYSDQIDCINTTSLNNSVLISLLLDTSSILKQKRFWISPAWISGPPQSDAARLALPALVQIFFHIILLTEHLSVLILLPLMAFSPVLFLLVFLLGAMICHGIICSCLNLGLGRDKLISSPKSYHSSSSYVSSESWILMGGIGVNGPALQAQLDKLSNIFCRRVESIPSRTSGILLDILRCFWLRSFYLTVPPTRESQEMYFLVKERLCNPSVSRLILLAHSSGALHASSVLDRLFRELSHDLLSKMEVYTFGAHCNHFHNPMRPNTARHVGGSTEQHGQVKQQPDFPSRGNEPSVGNMDRLIPYIEHYASRRDPFALMGVLSKDNRCLIRGTIFELLDTPRARGLLGGFYSLNSDYLAAFKTASEVVYFRNDGSRNSRLEKTNESQDQNILRERWYGHGRLAQYLHGERPVSH